MWVGEGVQAFCSGDERGRPAGLSLARGRLAAGLLKAISGVLREPGWPRNAPELAAHAIDRRCAPWRQFPDLFRGHNR